MRVVDYLDRDQAILSHSTGRILHLGLGVSLLGLAPEEQLARIEGSLHGRLTARFSDVLAVELDEESVGVYQKVLGNAVVGDVERLEELSLGGPFDTVVAADIIEHLSNPGRMLDGLHGHCHPGTRLIVTTPHAFGLPALGRYVLGRFREAPDHVLAFNLFGLVNLLARHGFEAEYAATCHQSTVSGAKLAVGSAVLRRLPRFGGTIFMVARPMGDSNPTAEG